MPPLRWNAWLDDCSCLTLKPLLASCFFCSALELNVYVCMHICVGVCLGLCLPNAVSDVVAQTKKGNSEMWNARGVAGSGPGFAFLGRKGRLLGRAVRVTHTRGRYVSLWGRRCCGVSVVQKQRGAAGQTKI